MPSHLADRLLQAGHQRFVGRAAECRQFDQTLQAEALPFCVWHLYGPGGVGKTSLLREFAYRSRAADVRCTYLDLRSVEAHPRAFLRALADACGAASADALWDHLEQDAARSVLLLDTFEAVAGLERWLYTRFLPRLAEETLVVVASRQAPTPQADPAWRSLRRTLPLRNLSREEGRALLEASGLPMRHHDTTLDFTHGHPLALTLVAEVYAQRADLSFEPSQDPDVIGTLVARFAMKVPSPAHRTAIEAAALVRFLTEPLLAQMMGVDDAHDLFDWLRNLSFVEAGPEGLIVHDLARKVLCADLRWRNPDWFQQLHRRARGYYTTRLLEAPPTVQRSILSDYVFLQRDNPIVRPFFDQLRAQWAEQGSAALLEDAYEPPDAPALEAMVARHEGPAAVEWLRFWLDRQPEQVTVYRDEAGRPKGFVMALAMGRASVEDLAADPATRAATGFLARHAPLREGEQATHFRFWMAEAQHQDVSPVQSLIFIHTVRHYLSTPGLAFSFIPCVRPAFWNLIFSYVNLQRIEAADYGVGTRSFGVYGHDWRRVPPMQWLDKLAERGLHTHTPPPREAPAFLVLDHDAFREAVRDAFRAYTQPTELAHNPLLRSRLVRSQMDGAEGFEEAVAHLQDLLRAAAATLQATPRKERCYRALDRTYLRPAGTQEAAADLVGVPYSTFRRHLTKGLDAVAEILWEQELGGTR